MKTITRGLLAFAVAASLEVPAYSQTLDREYNLEIERQPLAAALTEFSKQTGLQIGYFPETLTENIYIGPISGRYTAEAAISQLLLPAGLSFERLNERTIAVTGMDLPKSERRSFSTLERTADDRMVPSFVRLPNLRLAEGSRTEDFKQIGAAAPAQDADSKKQRLRGLGSLEEIVVTAQKRGEERLQGVPAPITAISADTLVDRNQLRLEDYYAKIPGLSYSSAFEGGAILAIRGIITDPYSNPTVGVTVDDLPYGSSTVLAAGNTVPDLDPSDLARIEVLRGPQGTLYGASSMGGLLKYITVDPSTDRVSGRVQAGTSAVSNGNELGYGARGSINVPLSDTWAVRASGFTRRDPGYIDNVLSGEEAINWTDANGGRLVALWRPSEALSLKLGALVQNKNSNGAAVVFSQPGLKDLQVSSTPNAGWYDRESQVYSANLSAKFGSVDLTSVSGYSIDSNESLGSALASLINLGLLQDNRTTKITQEIRLSASVGPKVEWMLGGFYTNEDSSYDLYGFFPDPTTGELGPLAFSSFYPTEYREYAGFADLTYHFSDRFDVQIGGRQSKIRTIADESATQSLASAEDSAFTYLVTPRFTISSNFMVYARLASGYRTGATNVEYRCIDPNLPCDPNLPRQYGPDETQNYEIGVKGNVFDHALAFDASIYYIDWKDLQLVLFAPQAPGGAYRINGGRAKSQGVELSFESRPLGGLTISAWVTWSDAQLTKDLPPTALVSGVSGSRLPESSRFSGALSIDQEFPMRDVTGFVGAAISYVGDRRGVFVSPSQMRETAPAYARADVHAGVRYDAWSLSLFVNNVLDRRGILSRESFLGVPNTYYIQPRTAGLSVAREF